MVGEAWIGLGMASIALSAVAIKLIPSSKYMPRTECNIVHRSTDLQLLEIKNTLHDMRAELKLISSNTSR